MDGAGVGGIRKKYSVQTRTQHISTEVRHVSGMMVEEYVLACDVLSSRENNDERIKSRVIYDTSVCMLHTYSSWLGIEY